MAFPLYLAMTAGELQCTKTPPPHLCYMACHFSDYTTGLSNIPDTLPAGSILILNDRVSIHGHDAQRVAQQLLSAAQELEADGILLDLQRPYSDEARLVVEAILSDASLPVAVTPPYAHDLTCPVFLPSPPVNCPLEVHIAPWKDREVWLEAALEVQQITVTKDGSSSQLTPQWDAPEEGLIDSELHCHYHIDSSPKRILFTLWRTGEDLQELLKEAQKLGISRGVGLYQELRDFIL